jgi:hypothetical protein
MDTIIYLIKKYGVYFIEFIGILVVFGSLYALYLLLWAITGSYY